MKWASCLFQTKSWIKEVFGAPEPEPAPEPKKILLRMTGYVVEETSVHKRRTYTSEREVTPSSGVFTVQYTPPCIISDVTFHLLDPNYRIVLVSINEYKILSRVPANKHTIDKVYPYDEVRLDIAALDDMPENEEWK